MNEMLKQFNLPGYIDGLSFADASKKIQSRFKDRVDRESVETERELLGRLRDMQEHVKANQQQKEQVELDKNRDPNAVIAGENDISNISSDEADNIEENYNDDNMMGQIKNAYGGYQNNKYWSGGYEDTINPYMQSEQPQTQELANVDVNNSPSTSGISSLASNAGGYASLGTTAISLGQEAFGDQGVDKSGAVRVKPKKVGNAALSGAAKGATAGAVLGPWGAAAGAVVGAAAGYIGAKKQNKEAIVANRNATYADASKNDNMFADGGPVNKPNRPVADELYPSLLNNYDIFSEIYTPNIAEQQIVPDQTKAQFEKYYSDNSKKGISDNIASIGKKALDYGEKGIDKVGDNLDLLRYAPVAGNIMQLANLQKPEQETTRELGNRYNKQYFDENTLLNLVREETNANREAILSSSGGSDSAARANLLGSQLNSTKALSDAYMKSAELNAQENRQEQSFNLGVDQANLGQSNLAQDIRARNKGNYETQKSALQAAVATDLGSIGQEELYKKFPELLEMDYNWKGKYQKLKEDTDKKKK